MTPQKAEARRHLLTVSLEDYYQVGAFNTLIQRRQWYRFENRLEQGTMRALALLDEYGVQATFFVLGWIAEIIPELVRHVADRGHEIASRGFYHRGIRTMTPAEFKEDLARSREALERAAQRRILGYRVADKWFEQDDLWALDVLTSEGYEYDSSIAPIFRRYAAEPWRRFVHSHHFGDRVLWEYPITSTEVLGNMIPVSGGNYLRQFPHWFVSRALAQWDRQFTSPMVLYFHTWELDPDQPKISAASWLAHVRQYRHLDQMESILRYYLSQYRLTGIADYMGLSTLPLTPAGRLSDTASRTPLSPVAQEIRTPAERSELTPVTVVVPCYNEESILPYLANTLASVKARLGSKYDLRFIFVDDRSTDYTWPALHRTFGRMPNTSILRHQDNRGVAAAIMTGMSAAQTEIVCSIDCDCTYDPHELARMIPLLEGADLVTASPYHPEGVVRNVPGWRLFLSRRLSALYRMVLGRRIHTWTSCFRVYRRSSAVSLQLTRDGFLGIAETIAMMVLRGARVVEHPATLEVRILGRSKMKVAKTIAGHLRLITRLVSMRAFGRPVPTVQLEQLPQPDDGSERVHSSITHSGT
jgi:polysaccharide deacetylase family protein (PEP-CTERM system associated)